jgi:hypothetical protein
LSPPAAYLLLSILPERAQTAAEGKTLKVAG